MWIRRHRDPAPPFVDGDGVLVRIALALAEANTVDGALDTLARELTSTVARASECTISTWDPVGDQLVAAAVAYADSGPRRRSAESAIRSTTIQGFATSCTPRRLRGIPGVRTGFPGASGTARRVAVADLGRVPAGRRW